ncbi:MAG: hypothetical protein J6A01_04850 [Proteobacteria bacterium]|nr:hypothetical protein [Pseudomonadota bacterium]
MNNEELTREFEKAPKSLMSAKPNEMLFAEDYPEGRMKIVCAAMDQDLETLRSYAAKVMAQPEGAKHLVRALNNLKAVEHHGAIAFVRVIFEALKDDWDSDTQILKLLQILDSVNEKLRTGLGWLDEIVMHWLDEGKLSQENRMNIWFHWCAAVLRSSPEASPLIENIAPRRLKNLSKSQAQALRQRFKDESQPWDMRSAAMYLMLGNQLISLEDAQSFVDEAYASFPLEALEGVEILAIAVEHDASILAEFDVIQAKLAQIRKDNLYLRDMNEVNFTEASTAILSNQSDLPGTAIEIAMELQALDKNKRMIASALIDDARFADWLYLAKKYRVIKVLSGLFFEHFCPENPVLMSWSTGIVSSLLELENADALLAESWNNAVETGDVNALRQMQPQWIAFCK